MSNAGTGAIDTSPRELEANDAGSKGPTCGYKGKGRLLQVDGSVQVCVPPVVCTSSETCQRGLGTCIAGECVYTSSYAGLSTLPEAWSTYYCDLASGGCDGSVTKPRPYELAKSIVAKFGPVCADAKDTMGTCVGVAAAPALMVGNSRIAKDPATGSYVQAWGLGMTAASGVCYRVTGSGGTAVVALTDRCGGYCKCGSGSFSECSSCLNASDTTVACPCVGTAPPLYTAECAGAALCDWCASGNHPHFDFDNATFAHVCGEQGLHAGSCRLSKVEVVEDCYPASSTWPD